MKQVELAQRLGISKSYTMPSSNTARIEEYPLSPRKVLAET